MGGTTKKTVTGYIKFKNTAVRLQPSMSKTGKKTSLFVFKRNSI